MSSSVDASEAAFCSPAPSSYFPQAAAAPPYYLPQLPPPPQPQTTYGMFYPPLPPIPYPPYQILPGPPTFYPPAGRGAFNNSYYPSSACPPRPFFRGGRSRGRGQSATRSHAHFECKACSKEYKTEETYSAHLGSHQKVRNFPYPPPYFFMLFFF